MNLKQADVNREQNSWKVFEEAYVCQVFYRCQQLIPYSRLHLPPTFSMRSGPHNYDPSMRLTTFLTSLLWAALGAAGYQNENPLSVEIASNERAARFFYVQAKDDEAADALQRNAAHRDRKLSSQLRAIIERSDVNLADKQEDYNFVRNAMVSLQQKIKQAKHIQSEHAQELSILDVDQNHLQAVQSSEQQSLLENKERILGFRTQAKLMRKRQKQLEKSISAILSVERNANMEKKKLEKSIKEQKMSLKIIAEKLVHEDRKADLVERQGILAKKKAIYQKRIGDDNGRQLEDLSMFDLGKGLIFSDKASTIRKKFTQKYKMVQKLESNQENSARKIEDLRRQLSPEFIGMASLKQYLFNLKSAEHDLQERERVISQQLQMMKRLQSRNRKEANILSEENERGALKNFAWEKEQLLTQLGDLSRDETREREAAVQDRLLQQELDHAANLHLLSMDKMGDAAADAAESARRLLASSSLLNSVAADNKGRN